MSEKKEMIILNRDTRALLIPSAAPMMLYQGTEVTIVQALGDSYTVSVYGNLARIEGKDADALGKTVPPLFEKLPKNATIKEKVFAQLKSVYDPEIPVNIVDLGLVYDCEIALKPDIPEKKYEVFIEMTLTAPGCNMGPVIAEDAKRKLLLIPEIDLVNIEIVFDPPWSREMMSEAAQLELGVI